MKFVDEYRDISLVQNVRERIASTVTRPWTIMEVCGGQTHSIMRYGIHEMLPKNIRLIHGPGCPVCVTPEHLIDHAFMLAKRENHILCSFGDMLRVPGGEEDLLHLKAKGHDVRIILSPLDAVHIAEKHPEKEVTLFAVGFETTAPATAMAALMARQKGLSNFSLLASHVVVPPALDFLMQAEGCQIDGLLAAGHVCTIEGYEEYLPLVEKHQKPIVITGFEPLDILSGMLRCIEMLQTGAPSVANQYSRCVIKEGNRHAKEAVRSVFERVDRPWRGIGVIPKSGLALKEAFAFYDAAKRYPFYAAEEKKNGCLSGLILQGKKRPSECPLFGKECTPRRPLGAPMVSSEGACSAYYMHRQMTTAPVAAE